MLRREMNVRLYNTTQIDSTKIIRKTEKRMTESFHTTLGIYYAKKKKTTNNKNFTIICSKQASVMMTTTSGCNTLYLTPADLCAYLFLVKVRTCLLYDCTSFQWRRFSSKRNVSQRNTCMQRNEMEWNELHSKY